MQHMFVKGRMGRVHCRAAGTAPPLFMMPCRGRWANEFDAPAEKSQCVRKGYAQCERATMDYRVNRKRIRPEVPIIVLADRVHCR